MAWREQPAFPAAAKASGCPDVSFGYCSLAGVTVAAASCDDL